MRKRLPALALALALLCSGCAAGGKGQAPAEGEVQVWFLANENGAEGSALASEFRAPPQGETVEGLMALLLSGPEGEGLRSPFPAGTRLRGWELGEDGTLRLDMNETYGGLNGAELTLADGCVTLTLCRLPRVERVYLTVEGRPRPFRDQVLGPGDFLLENGAGGETELEVRLWFPGGEGLAAEERTLALAMGDDPATAAVQALLAGPESGELEPVCPEGTALLSLTREGERYVVDVSGAWLEGERDPRRARAIAATLSELTPGAQVELRVEGQETEE